MSVIDLLLYLAAVGLTLLVAGLALAIWRNGHSNPPQSQPPQRLR